MSMVPGLSSFPTKKANLSSSMAIKLRPASLSRMAPELTGFQPGSPTSSRTQIAGFSMQSSGIPPSPMSGSTLSLLGLSVSGSTRHMLG
jgi:hypothetical protein